MRFVCGLAGLAALVAAAPAFAWGPEGHAIVAGIAAREITPAARRKIEALLGGPAAQRMAEVSSVADWEGRDRPETRPWHYVDIEIGSAGYDAARDCAGGNCIVAAIARDEAVLRNRRAGRDARAEALVWLIHLIGDLHQPLHCADHDDRGGNAAVVRIPGRNLNLHALWDRAPDALPEAAGGNEASAAAALDREIAPEKAAAWRSGSVTQWTNESFRIARDRIYRPLLAGNGAAAAPDPQVVRSQLQKAGIRLALLLNRDLQ